MFNFSIRITKNLICFFVYVKKDQVSVLKKLRFSYYKYLKAQVRFII